MGLAEGPVHARAEGTFQVNDTARCPKITVSADGQGIVCQAGGVLLGQTLRLTGLDGGLSAALGRWRAPRAVHDPGKIIADLAVTLAMGGDCLADIAMLRAQPLLSGPVASDPVVSRLIAALAADAPRALKAIRGARAAARQRAWELAGDAAPGADGGVVTVDLDATIVTACSPALATRSWRVIWPSEVVSSRFRRVVDVKEQGLVVRWHLDSSGGRNTGWMESGCGSSGAG